MSATTTSTADSILGLLKSDPDLALAVVERVMRELPPLVRPWVRTGDRWIRTLNGDPADAIYVKDRPESWGDQVGYFVGRASGRMPLGTPATLTEAFDLANRIAAQGGRLLCGAPYPTDLPGQPAPVAPAAPGATQPGLGQSLGSIFGTSAPPRGLPAPAPASVTRAPAADNSPALVPEIIFDTRDPRRTR